ncbi:SNF2 family N-terminal domain-containing protein [Hysterangium stoloniferum]|nr:SNF2 family N-terminal domain-containing protein [Hysterangium stoloniferum]
MHQQQHQHHATLHQPQLPPEVPPRTPVCIGQLTVTALVLYPTPYVNHRPPDPSNPDCDEFAAVRLRYDPLAKERSPTAEETIHISTPQTKTGEGADERSFGGDNFGVVEQKVASVLGPMLGKGLIRVDAKVRRGMPNLPILPLHLLLFTPKGNIPIVSTYLHTAALMLDHPAPPFDLNNTRLQSVLYSNPHNPPPGGFGRSGAFARAPCLPGARHGWGGTRWNTVAPSGKSVEVQRSQVDEVFKSLKSGDELEETEAPIDIQTKLYPHQKKALTFLLEREGEISGPARDPDSKDLQPLTARWEGKYSSSSLWTVRKDPSGRIVSWMHAVTNREVYSEPKECKAALLADDMGLGKTITCVSLIGSTIPVARAFGNNPVNPPPRMPVTHSSSEPSLTAGHFQGSVWNMPEGTSSSSSGKQKGKGKLEEKREAEEYTRACRLKVKSRATLIVCPLSTVVNWEDQFKEHWAGEVSVVGGATGTYTSPKKKPNATAIRVYVYHGNARNSDPLFLADFDAVITTFATLASEFSKQSRSGDDGDDDESDGETTTIDEYGQMMSINGGSSGAKKGKNKKRKKGGGPEQSSPLQMVHWFRVVLDEAHSIKETSTVASRASCDLVADRRLCLTGTPVQNKLDDVYALIKFLRLEPFDDKAVWTEYVGGPVKFGQPLGVARLQTIMKCITLRRTKETKHADGTKILSLPPRRDELRLLKFDEKEQKIYNGFYDESKAEFNQMSENNEVMKNYVGILQKILRLRQICDHFELVKGKGILSDESETVNYEDLVNEIAREGINAQRGTAIFALLRESGTAQCVECGFELAPPVDDIKEEGVDEEAGAKRSRKIKASLPNSRNGTRQNSPMVPRPVLTRCQHLFCIECFRTCICPGWPNVPNDIQRGCSACQAGLAPQDAVELNLDAPAAGDVKKKPGKREKRQKGMPLQNLYFSTKVKALMADLVEFSKSNPHSRNYDPDSLEVQMVDEEGNGINDGIVKTVVFSQWTSMLDKIEDALETADIQYDRLDGTMKRDDRTRAMDALKFNPACEVLLVSLKAGGVGLNLTAAQRVYLMDPYWQVDARYRPRPKVNPAVENQAVDRIHRLGQKKPVTTVKLIIENSIEARLLEVQKRKTALANMTLNQNISKAELMQRRLEELNQLFG